MSVLNVLDTQTVSASGTAYITVKTGVIRVLATAASSIQVGSGPAITLAAGVPELLSVGKPKTAKISAATDANPTVLTLEGYSNGGRHTFTANDTITTSNGGDTAFVAAYVTAGSAGKKAASVTATTITTDLDASSASGDYALSEADVVAGTVPIVQRTALLTAGSGSGGVVVEQVQIVGG